MAEKKKVFSRKIRLQLFISQSGVCSRREAAAWIKSGRCLVNGQKTLQPSYPIEPGEDKVLLDGEKLQGRKKTYLLLHKPRGSTSTRRDKFAKTTVLNLLPKKFEHLYPVGRLDKETTGLLFLTNDGELTFRLTHPRFGVEKTYQACLDKVLLPKDRKSLERGIVIEGKKTSPCRILSGRGRQVEIVLREGRKRQLRRMFSLRGYSIKKLRRTKEGGLALKGLLPGAWRLLSPGEVKKLRAEVGLG